MRISLRWCLFCIFYFEYIAKSKMEKCEDMCGIYVFFTIFRTPIVKFRSF